MKAWLGQVGEGQEGRWTPGSLARAPGRAKGPVMAASLAEGKLLRQCSTSGRPGNWVQPLRSSWAHCGAPPSPQGLFPSLFPSLQLPGPASFLQSGLGAPLPASQSSDD